MHTCKQNWSVKMFVNKEKHDIVPMTFDLQNAYQWLRLETIPLNCVLIHRNDNNDVCDCVEDFP